MPTSSVPYTRCYSVDSLAGTIIDSLAGTITIHCKKKGVYDTLTCTYIMHTSSVPYTLSFLQCRVPSCMALDSPHMQSVNMRSFIAITIVCTVSEASSFAIPTVFLQVPAPSQSFGHVLQHELSWPCIGSYDFL